MHPPASVHPADETLVSYGLGKLDDTLADDVDKHLEQCPPCRRRVAELSSDSFVGRLRDVQVTPEGKRQSLPAESEKSNEPATMALGSPSAARIPEELADHPHYEVMRELGHGGMGVVYLARNRLMDRLEVLKVLKKEMLAKQGRVDRFLREIQAAAKLDHRNVVAAYSALTIGELFVLAMEYVKGSDLAKVVGRLGPLSINQACNFVSQAALGLQHAYERDMVHRDIKPGNLILLKDKGQAVVKILDFGLAKFTTDRQFDAALTHEGQMLGTPDYIAPEQILEPQNADIRADIYSLGCTLYFLLTGEPPFKRDSVFEVLLAHRTVDAELLNVVRPDAPAELAAVFARMMAKDRNDRYQTPAELIQALRPFCKQSRVARTPGEIRATLNVAPTSRGNTGTVAKPLDRDTSARIAGIGRPAWIWTIGILATLVLCLAVAGWGGAFVNNTKNNSTAASPPGAQSPTAGSESEVAESKPQQDGAHVKDDTVLRHVQPKGIGLHPHLRIGFSNDALQVVYDNNDPRFVVAENIPPGQPLNITRLFLCREDRVPTVANPQVFENREVNLWLPVKEGACAQAVPQPAGQNATLRSTRPLPDGVYCLHTRILADSQPTPEFSAPFVVRGWGLPHIATAIPEVGASQIKLSVIVQNVGLGEFNDGFVAATLQRPDGTLAESNAGQRKPVLTIPVKGQQRVELFWSTSGLKGEYSFRGHINFEHSSDVVPLATFQTESFMIGNAAPAATTISAENVPSANAAGQAAPQGQEFLNLTGHTDAVYGVAVSPDGKWIASGSGDATVNVWDASNGHKSLTLGGHTDWVRRVAFSPDSKQILGASWDKSLKLWDMKTGQKVHDFNGHADRVTCIAFSPDGKRIVSGCWDKMLKLWDASGAKELRTSLADGNGVWCVAFSPDGRQIASGGSDDTVKLWDADGGQKLRELNGVRAVEAVTFSPDGKRILCGCYRDWNLKIWDAATGKETVTLVGHVGPVLSAAFSPDGTQIVSGSEDKTLKLWDASTGRELLTLTGHAGKVNSVAFTPDGQRVVSGSDDKTVKVWDVRHARTIAIPTAAGSDSFSIKNMKVEILKPGRGDSKCRIGDFLTVRYVTTLPDGRLFDTAHVEERRPLTFKLGSDPVCKGWHVGLLGMKVGEKRRLTMPPEFIADLTGEIPSTVPANTNLISEVELLELVPGGP